MKAGRDLKDYSTQEFSTVVALNSNLLSFLKSTLPEPIPRAIISDSLVTNPEPACLKTPQMTSVSSQTQASIMWIKDKTTWRGNVSQTKVLWEGDHMTGSSQRKAKITQGLGGWRAVGQHHHHHPTGQQVLTMCRVVSSQVSTHKWGSHCTQEANYLLVGWSHTNNWRKRKVGLLFKDVHCSIIYNSKKIAVSGHRRILK